ncbi:hypothetical protein FKW77_005756 [Venturia effusa]|uniref:Major facilitator superfamily (MFS) profile domain-containing protein n=1 Tax=Venturia effusa TaxID=50376 RepID=A0A517LP37_9PEZI|nr:hypothetical protein FKW77_005756 [Venturia effusa]
MNGSNTKTIIELAAAEGHDADVPSNAGTLHENKSKQWTTSPSATEIGSTDLEKDIEKEGAGSREESVLTTPIPSIHEKPKTESQEQDDANVVWWEGPDDLENPLNWSSKRKWAAIGMVSLVTFLTPLGSSIFAPGVPLVMEEFGSDSQILEGFVVSVYVLGFAFGPLIIAPLSEMFGRLPLYHASACFFVIFNIACAVSSSLNQLIVFRFFAGSFGAAPLALGGGTIADVASKEQRATAMAIWVLGPTVGPVIGPIVGGFISHYLGWRWNFWILSMAAGCALIGGIALMKETYAPTILKRKTARLRKETGNVALRSKLDIGLTPGQLFRYSIVRPTKMLAFSPIVFSVSLYVAIVYSYLYLMFTTVTVIFETQYGFATDLVGLAFLGIGIGSFGGQFIYTYAANRSYAAHVAKGDFKPEHRLETMIPGAFMVPISLFWYGWSVQANVQWMCPIIGMSIFGFGLLLIFMPANTYLIDVFTSHAASAMAANTVLRSVVAAILPMAGPKLYAALGYGWGNSLLGFVAAAMIPIPFVFLKYGERIRTSPRYQSGAGPLGLCRAGQWLSPDHRIHHAWLAKQIQHVAQHPQPLHPVLVEFKELIESSTRLSMLFTQMFQEMPRRAPYMLDPAGHRQIHDYTHMLEVMNHLLTQPPAWNDYEDRVGVVGVPFQVLYDWPMGTASGYAVFQDPSVNKMLKKILNVWGEFLASPSSSNCLGTNKEGWFSEVGKRELEKVANEASPKQDREGTTKKPFEDLFHCDPTQTHHGYKSWDDFFTRRFRFADGIRPTASPQNDLVIANACESRPYKISRDVSAHDVFWAKGQPFSVHDILAHDPWSARFVGGTIYQAFLSALSYHRWHAPVSGKVVKVRQIEGTYFSEAPFTGFLGPRGELDVEGQITGQSYLAAMATRCLIFIEADCVDIGLVCVVPVGMVEVSTCEVTVREGQRVEKGDELDSEEGRKPS